MIAYIILFFTALGAATILPIYSEVAVIAMLAKGYAWFWVWIVASLGNTIGSLINYLLALKGTDYIVQKGYIDSKRVVRYKSRFAKYGGWMLLLSWMPVIGDPITFVAGALRYDIKRFIVIVFIAKALRYGFLVLGYYGWVGL